MILLREIADPPRDGAVAALVEDQKVGMVAAWDNGMMFDSGGEQIRVQLEDVAPSHPDPNEPIFTVLGGNERDYRLLFRQQPLHRGGALDGFVVPGAERRHRHRFRAIGPRTEARHHPSFEPEFAGNEFGGNLKPPLLEGSKRGDGLVEREVGAIGRDKRDRILTGQRSGRRARPTLAPPLVREPSLLP